MAGKKEWKKKKLAVEETKKEALTNNTSCQIDVGHRIWEIWMIRVNFGYVSLSRLPLLVDASPLAIREKLALASAGIMICSIIRSAACSSMGRNEWQYKCAVYTDPAWYLLCHHKCSPPVRPWATHTLLRIQQEPRIQSHVSLHC